ncbi:CIC11C00000005942 [Sungouiella intermedia]|uniref:CIC11C00000005942 n=1 Tax=Sungouiella intermedia TaxID=45354 RepID=A0A1L0BBZ4_9ASCO|nr:CIC11C00000005942 [[Candida] intermedia]
MDHRKQFIGRSFPNVFLEIEDVLETNGITAFEILSLCRLPEDEAINKLSQKINLSPNKIRTILNEMRYRFISHRNETISPLVKNPSIPSGLQTLDKLLSGGISLGSLTEVFGSSGSGKSQFLLQIALQAQLQTNCQGMPGKCIYISTESALETRRLSQMVASNGLLPEGSLNNITTIYCQDEESQDHIFFTQLPSKLRTAQDNKENYTLVIIDSIGHHFRLQESFINNLAYLRTYLKQQEMELNQFPTYTYLRSDFERVTNKFLRGNSSFRNRSMKKLYLLDLYRHLYQMATTFNVAILIANQVSDLVKDQSEPGGICDPLDFNQQVGSFSGWQHKTAMAPLFNLLEKTHGILSQNSKRRKLSKETSSVYNVHANQPPEKILALGYTWAKLVSHKILLWKTYELRLAKSQFPLSVESHNPEEQQEGMCSTHDEEGWERVNFAKVITPINVNSHEAVQFRIVPEGLKQS